MRTVCLFVLLCVSALSYGAKKYKLVEISTNLGNIKIRLYENTPRHSENFLKLVKAHHYDSLLFHRVIGDFMIQGGSSDSRHAPKETAVGMSNPGYTIEAEIRPEYRHFKGALAAARQGDEVNPEKRSSGEQFYLVQGKTYTDQELDQIEKRKWLAAKNQLGDRLFKPLQEEFQRYKKTGQYQKADSLLRYVNEEIEKQYAENPYKMSPETREMYKSVGGTPFLDGDYTVFGEIVEGMDVLEKIALVATDSNDRPKEGTFIKYYKISQLIHTQIIAN
ncbi:peptidylprolyl isomerase [Odoribacter splanchnicus]|uniref:peptidylprolyl isomerase n=1 Tax=Odoribacter splanchnicus TaxID=28118 RepID=UPI001896F253|nr:peptidylprolyl isomerase [Odoribacter splanchnicus]